MRDAGDGALCPVWTWRVRAESTASLQVPGWQQVLGCVHVNKYNLCPEPAVHMYRLPFTHPSPAPCCGPNSG